MLIKKITALILLPAILIFNALVASFLLSVSGVFERTVTDAASRLVGAIVEIQDVKFEPFGGIDIRGLTLRMADDARPLLRVRSLVLHFSAASLLAGSPFPGEVVLDEPVFWLPQDNEALKPEPGRKEEGAEAMTVPPISISVRNGSLEMEGWDLKIRTINAAMRTEDGDFVLDEAVGRLAGGTIRVEGALRNGGETPGLSFTVSGDKILCSPGLEPLLQRVGALKDYHAFQPDGLADFVFESDPVRKGSRITGRLSLTPRSTAVTYIGYPDGRTGAHDSGVPYPLRDVEGAVMVRIPGHVLIEEARGAIGPGRFTVKGKVDALGDRTEREIFFEGRDMELDDPLFQALDNHAPEVVSVLRQLEARGRADITVNLDSGPPPGGASSGSRDSFSVKALMRGVSVRPEFFPLPLDDVYGPVRYEKGTCTFEGLRARHNGTVITGKGSISREAISLSLRAEPVDVDQDLLGTLRGSYPEAADFLESLEISGGIVKVLLDYEKKGGTNSGGTPRAAMRFHVTLEGCSARPGFFPLTLDGIRGSAVVEVSSAGIERVAMEGLTGSHAGSVLEISALLKGPDVKIESLTIAARNQELTAELLAVLAEREPDLGAALEDLGVEGAVDARYVIEGGGDGQRLLIALKGCSARPGFFPVLLENLRGSVAVDVGASGIERIELQDVTASHAGSSLAATGLLEGPDLDVTRLEVTGRHQRLSAEILGAFCKLEPRAAEYLDDFTVEGGVDFTCIAGEEGIDLVLKPRFDSIDGAKIPWPFTNIHGSIAWSSSRNAVTVEDLSARMREGIVIVEQGEIALEEGGASARLRVSGQGLRLKQDLKQLLEDESLESWNLIGVDGLVNLGGIDLSITTGEGGEFLELKATGDVYFEGASLSEPLSLTGIFGGVALDVRIPGGDGGAYRVEGVTKNLAFEVAEKEFSNIRTSFFIDEHSLKVIDVEGNHFGGYITSEGEAFTMDFAPPQPFSGRLQVKGVDLGRLIGNSGYAFRDISGRLDWNISWWGEAANVHNLQARGRVSVEEGHLWKLPVFSSLLEVVGGIVGFANLPVFEKGSARFRMEEGVLTLSDAVLHSPLLTLQGSGDLTVDSANVQVRFSVGPKLPIIGDVIAPVMNLIKQGIFNLRVRGSYDNMEVFYDPIATSLFRTGEITETGRIPPRRGFKVFGRF